MGTPTLLSGLSMVRQTTPIEDRFWPKVNKAGPVPERFPHLGACWVWTGSTNGKYGKISLGRKGAGVEYAHRVAWRLENGPIPPNMDICHRCDNPPCVRESHLFLGTRHDNMVDAGVKGSMKRDVSGEKNPRAKMTRVGVASIQEYVKSGMTYEQASEQFGVSVSQVGRVVRGEHWV